MGVSGVCVPYPVPHKKLLDINTIVKLLPNFGYQAFFANSASTKKIEENVSLFPLTFFPMPFSSYTSCDRESSFLLFESKDMELISGLSLSSLPSPRSLPSSSL